MYKRDEMTGKIFFGILLLFLTSFSAVSEVLIDYDAEVNQGKILPVYLMSDTEINDITLSLARNGKVYVKFRGFRIDREKYSINSERFCFIILISAASDIYPSEYDIDIRWQEDGYSEKKTGKIKVLEDMFQKEEILLSKSMTSIRKDESDRRKRETKAIIRLYRQFNTDEQFHGTGFDYPLKGEYPVTSRYGDRRIFIYDNGESSKSLHNGIDFAAVRGTPVYSSGQGKVVFSGNRLITGNSIIIEHNPGFYSVYYHLDRTDVSDGVYVEKREKIGEVGSSGISTGNHLHWEMRNQGVAVDPEQYIGFPVIDKERIISHIKASFSDIDRGR